MHNNNRCMDCGAKSIINFSTCYKWLALCGTNDDYHKASLCQNCYDFHAAYQKALNNPINKNRNRAEFTKEFIKSYNASRKKYTFHLSNGKQTTYLTHKTIEQLLEYVQEGNVSILESLCTHKKEIVNFKYVVRVEEFEEVPDDLPY